MFEIVPKYSGLSTLTKEVGEGAVCCSQRAGVTSLYLTDSMQATIGARTRAVRI